MQGRDWNHTPVINASERIKKSRPVVLGGLQTEYLTLTWQYSSVEKTHYGCIFVMFCQRFPVWPLFFINQHTILHFNTSVASSAFDKQKQRPQSYVNLYSSLILSSAGVYTQDSRHQIQSRLRVIGSSGKLKNSSMTVYLRQDADQSKHRPPHFPQTLFFFKNISFISL